MIVQLRQSKGGSDGLVHAVRDGSADIALTAFTTVPPPGIALHPLVTEPMVFICLPGHPLGQRPSVTVPDLREEKILRSPPGWAPGPSSTPPSAPPGPRSRSPTTS